jgi:hypothetical protein
MDKTVANTDIMTRSDSQMFQTMKAYNQKAQNTCFGSDIFK